VTTVGLLSCSEGDKTIRSAAYKFYNKDEGDACLYLRSKEFKMKMKYMFLCLLIFCSANVFASTTTDTLKVWGNCDECKSKIEKAALKAGAVSADWNADNYQLVISYNNEQTSAVNIEKEIAAVGYDTQDVKATDDAYHKLPKCCQYEREAKKETDQ